MVIVMENAEIVGIVYKSVYINDGSQCHPNQHLLRKGGNILLVLHLALYASKAVPKCTLL